jgi:hypothetical protein
MVQPTQHGNGDHLVRLVRYRSRKRWWVWDRLPKPLMGSGLMEGQHRGIEEAVELFLIEDQEMIQTFSPYAP